MANKPIIPKGDVLTDELRAFFALSFCGEPEIRAYRLTHGLDTKQANQRVRLMKEKTDRYLKLKQSALNDFFERFYKHCIDTTELDNLILKIALDKKLISEITPDNLKEQLGFSQSIDDIKTEMANLIKISDMEPKEKFDSLNKLLDKVIKTTEDNVKLKDAFLYLPISLEGMAKRCQSFIDEVAEVNKSLSIDVAVLTEKVSRLTEILKRKDIEYQDLESEELILKKVSKQFDFKQAKFEMAQLEKEIKESKAE